MISLFDAQTQLRGTLPLAGCVVEVAPSNGFAVKTSLGQSFGFAAPTAADADAWIRALKVLRCITTKIGVSLFLKFQKKYNLARFNFVQASVGSLSREQELALVVARVCFRSRVFFR